MLKQLEPFILSASKPEILTENDKELAAKLRGDHGKSVVIAVRSDFGQSRLMLPADDRYILLDGSAEWVDGKWFFSGSDIDFCILLEK